MTPPVQTIDPTSRRVPPHGGFNRTMLRIEIKRMLRNRRTIFFTLVFPAGALLRVRRHRRAGTTTAGHGNVAAYIMVSMALYGAALTAASAGAMVAMERALGWSRQLRLTPLSPVVYIPIKAIVALVMGAIAVAVVNVAGIVQGKPDMPARRLGRLRRRSRVLCTLVFAALGVFVGYLVPGENAMQILGPGLALLSFLGNVFIPIAEHSSADLAHRQVHPDVRRRQDRPVPADRRAALVRRRQRARLAGHLRGSAPPGG